MKNYAFFLGCITPNRYPGIEVATKKVLEAFDIKMLDVEGASCCPAPGVFGSFDLETWAIIAARNITIAEGMKADIATTCNGCYATLQEANHLLKHDEKLMERVNKSLESVGRQHTGEARRRNSHRRSRFRAHQDENQESVEQHQSCGPLWLPFP
jgi:heterodisulfide reductase subunit B